MSRGELLKKGFDQEVESWNSLYESASSTKNSVRYAIFQKQAAKRTQRRMALCLTLLDPKPEMKVLDVGCGSGAFSRAVVSKGANWVGLDLSLKMLRFGKHSAPENSSNTRGWINGNGHDLPFRDEAFDAAICVGMVNFYRKELLPPLLDEMARIVKPGGRVILTSLRLDVLTWIRSRLYPRIPLPISSPGPLYPLHYREFLRLIDPAQFECTDKVHGKKYLGLPHYTMFKLVRK